MLSPEISRRVDRLIAAHSKGIFNAREFALQLGELATTDNLEALSGHLPPELRPTLKDAIQHDNRRASNNECLEPEDSLFDQLANIVQYHSDVGIKLLESGRRKRRGILSVVCLPSFQPEWAIRLLGSEAEGHSLVFSMPEEEIWNSKTSLLIPVRHMEVAIPSDLAGLICESWRKMVLRTRHSEPGCLGLDGVTYHFAYGSKSGKTWSPEAGSAPGRLIALSRLLARYVEADESSRDGLEVEVCQQAEWFKTLP